MPNEILRSLEGLRLKSFVRQRLELLTSDEPGGWDDDWGNGFLEGQIYALGHVSRFLMTPEEAAEAELNRFKMFGGSW